MEKNLGVYETDSDSILSEINKREKDLILKRRWLIGLPTSHHRGAESALPDFLLTKPLPESLLREDDIFYETLEVLVEETLGACNIKREPYNLEASAKIVDKTDVRRTILSQLDVFTNKGLNLLAMALTGGSIQFGKTRRMMKTVIRESLPKVLRTINHKHDSLNVISQLSELVSDPKNFRKNFLRPSVESHRSTAIEVLTNLENLSSEALVAMNKKLNGVEAMPSLQRLRHGWTRENLICQVGRKIQAMLSEQCDGDKLQKQLAGALAIAGLSMKLKSRCSNSSMTDFKQLFPRIKTLQNEIIKAIQVLDSKVKLPDLKTLQVLQNAKTANGSLKTQIKRLLTGYLFKSSDMDAIPEPLLEALAVIKKSYQDLPLRCFSKDEIEEEVEFILSVSAQTKQIVLDLHPNHEFHQEFCDAYVEELEESDDEYDGYDNDDNEGNVNVEKLNFYVSSNNKADSFDSHSQIESCGSFMPIDSLVEPSSLSKRESSPTPSQESGDLKNSLIVKVNQKRVGRFSKSHSKKHFDSPIGLAPTFSSLGTKFACSKRYSSRNWYLRIQDACDDTCLVAYYITGFAMKELAEKGSLKLRSAATNYLRGDHSTQNPTEVTEERRSLCRDGAVRAVKELICSLPQGHCQPSDQRMIIDNAIRWTS